LNSTVKLEAYVARPPTVKCRQVIAVMEEVLRAYPDQTRLVVFERGAEWSEEPSRALKYAVHKCATIPLCFVGGKPVAGGKVPDIEEVTQAVEKALRRSSG
jgi:hypothetical protein